MDKYNYKCPNCDFVGNDKEWIETEVGCEECGSHLAYRCPECEEVYDNVRDERIEIYG
jgi:predicted RNA-binding Zn-ribbon protein involved in translation (DUF1610 family)